VYQIDNPTNKFPYLLTILSFVAVNIFNYAQILMFMMDMRYFYARFASLFSKLISELFFIASLLPSPAEREKIDTFARFIVFPVYVIDLLLMLKA
jgi:hypothetical protein